MTGATMAAVVPAANPVFGMTPGGFVTGMRSLRPLPAPIGEGRCAWISYDAELRGRIEAGTGSHARRIALQRQQVHGPLLSAVLRRYQD